MTVHTPAGLLSAALSANPARPLITFYDDATGERTELSAVSLDNWVSKTANLLVDGHSLGAGDTAAVALPPHWLTAAVMLGCWRAGLAISHGVPAGGAAPATGDAHDVPAGGPAVDIAFSDIERFAEQKTADVYGLSLAPMAAPLRDAPAGMLDYILEVRTFGDHYGGPPADPDAPSLTDLPRGAPALSHAALTKAAVTRATELGLTATDRILIAEPGRPLDWLLAPLAAGASVVLCRNADPGRLAARTASEKVTRTL